MEIKPPNYKSLDLKITAIVASIILTFNIIVVFYLNRIRVNCADKCDLENFKYKLIKSIAIINYCLITFYFTLGITGRTIIHFSKPVYLTISVIQVLVTGSMAVTFFIYTKLLYNNDECKTCLDEDKVINGINKFFLSWRIIIIAFFGISFISLIFKFIKNKNNKKTNSN